MIRRRASASPLAGEVAPKGSEGGRGERSRPLSEGAAPGGTTPTPFPLPARGRGARSILARGTWLLLALATTSPPALAAPEPACRPLDYEGARYTVCRADLRRDEIRLFWRRPDGEPYGSVGALADAVKARSPAFVMNAGMYHKDLSPVGLYVESGRELQRANTAAGRGNFHLKPNGVFYVGRGRAGILETGRYLRDKPAAEFATQSGPMLVIEGNIHPRITLEGPSKKRRNGVGLADPLHPVFVISEDPVSFGAFARLFRDGLGCPDALFLDGSISSLSAPGLTRLDSIFPAGPIVAVFPKTAARP